MVPARQAVAKMGEAMQTKEALDLEIKVALLGQRQDQLEASLQILDRRLSRMEESLERLHSTVAKWCGFCAAISAIGSMAAGAL